MAWLIVLVIALTCWILLEKFLSLSHDAKEPPIIPQTLPYVGHLLGMLRHGSRYYTQIRSVLAKLEVIYADIIEYSSIFPLPIYTLRVPRNKIYVVTSPSLVAAVDRHSKTISFAPYVVEFAKRMLLPSAEGLEALQANLSEEDGKRCTLHWLQGKTWSAQQKKTYTVFHASWSLFKLLPIKKTSSLFHG